MGKYTAKHDPHATGPRDPAEYEAFRAAHAALPHASLRAIADEIRLDAIMAAYHRVPRREAAERELAEVQKIKTKTDEEKAARARQIEASKERLDELTVEITIPDRAPCTVDRCPGHAIVAPSALRRAARARRPIPRPIRRPAPQSAPQPAEVAA